MLVIFEGMDKTGKSTLVREFNVATNYKHIVLDRGPLSSYVYDSIYNRGCRYSYEGFEKAICNINHLVVLCIASEYTIDRRLVEAGEFLPKEQIEAGGVPHIQKKFIEESFKSNMNVVTINTDESIEYCLDIIKECVKIFE